MTQKALMAAAVAFRDSKPWAFLDDSEMFAVRFGSGKLGYCVFETDSVDDPTVSLALYMDGTPLAAYFRLNAAFHRDSAVETYSALVQQEGLVCLLSPADMLLPKDQEALKAHGVSAGETALLPYFRKQRPFFEDWFLDDADDEKRLTQALRAAVHLVQRCAQEAAKIHDADPGDAREEARGTVGLGMDNTIPCLALSAVQQSGFALETIAAPTGSAFSYESITLSDEVYLMRLRKLPVNQGLTMYCELVPMPEPMEGEPPFFPVGLLVHAPKIKLTEIPAVLSFQDEKAELVAALMEMLEAHGRPEKIIVRDDLTHVLLGDIAAQIGLPIELQHDLPMLDGVIKRYYDE